MLAAALGLLIGLLIGGLGGGGGVLAVPLLVYVLGQSPQDATTGSVVVVGVTAVVGVLARLRGDLVRWHTGLAFAAVGVPAAAFGSVLNQRVPGPVVLLSFAALTVLAAVALLVDATAAQEEPTRSGSDVLVVAPTRPLVRATQIVGCGVVIGFLTGFLGVGGGFLAVPALVIVLRMPMVAAVGTSLLIIAVNSLAAFTARVGWAGPDGTGLDWSVLAPFTVAAVAASFAGKRIADRCSGATVTRAFAVLLLVVGGAVAVTSLVAL